MIKVKTMIKLPTHFERFFSLEAAGGVMLLISTGLALLWANSPWRMVYEALLHLPVGFQVGSISFFYSLHHWVNDALMVIFFFVAGLEIKRELVVGELSSPKKAALPIFAALGGMIVPAICYLMFNLQSDTQVGWGIPMATDIAFAIGILSLMSKKVPLSLKVFLLSLAIVDDLGAVLVIAFFYSHEIIGRFLAFASVVLFLIYCAKKAGIQNLLFYIISGVGLWFFVLKSGVHATVAGVVLGLMAPVENSSHTNAQQLIEILHPYVIWVIMPVFAFFNAGVVFSGSFSIGDFLSHPVSMGILMGLVIGKPVGILLFSLLGVRLKLAVYPSDAHWLQLAGVGCLAGIGFTMSLFISHLSFDSSELEIYSKLSILIASVLAMVLGFFILIIGSSFLSDERNREVA